MNVQIAFVTSTTNIVKGVPQIQKIVAGRDCETLTLNSKGWLGAKRRNDPSMTLWAPRFVHSLVVDARGNATEERNG